MELFNWLFRRSLSQKETEQRLDEIERLSKLPYFLPATVRIQMLSEKASSKLLGPGGVLHDRFAKSMERIIRGGMLSGKNQTVKITPAWEALPNVLMTFCDFEQGTIGLGGQKLLDALFEGTKEFVVFATVNFNVREQDPERQMRLFFNMVDNPRLMMSMLIFSGTFIVRALVILKHPGAVPSDLKEIFLKLGPAVSSEGKVREYR